MSSIESYLHYGVPSDLASKLVNEGISLTTLRDTSISNLVSKYGLDSAIAAEVKAFITRKPIDEDIVDQLLQNSNFTCCCCKGTKGQSYLIHHIEDYSISQNNDYCNLAVLCPACHDLARRGGGFTMRLTPEQIRKNKDAWGREVERTNAEAAAHTAHVGDVDYVNLPRIIEMSYQLLEKIPHLHVSTGDLRSHLKVIEEKWDRAQASGKRPEDLEYPCMLWIDASAAFKAVCPYLSFVNLDDLLKKRTIRSQNLVGTLCYHVGGLYGKEAPERPTTKKSPLAKLYLRRKGFIVEWLLNPIYITSTTAAYRLSGRTPPYVVYGSVRNVSKKSIKGKDFTLIDIRPYVVGLAKKTITRKPLVAYIKEAEALEEME